jgi:hypothetical protein
MVYSMEYTDVMMIVMGWDYVFELLSPTSLMFIPYVLYMSVENHGGMMSLKENSWFVHQSSLAIPPAVFW